MTGKRLAFFLASVAAVSAWLACGGGAGLAPSATRSPTPLDSLAATRCDVADQQKVQIVTHGEATAKYVEPVRAALSTAVNHADANYGWAPTEPVCVHLFPDPDAFVKGLRTLAGFDHVTAERFRLIFGMAGRDAEARADAVYVNAGMLAVPDWVAFTAAHEYFHVVQEHVGGTMGGPQAAFPTWFLEGIAQWEPVRFLGAPFPTWLMLLREEERRGREIPLSSLVTWEQWWRARQQAATSDNPLRVLDKARAAAMFLEQIAGPTAAAQILRDNKGGDLTGFESVFQQVSGLTLQEFEVRLREFISQGE